MRQSGATKVKICGIRTVEAIRTLKRLPVDYVGFIFANSKRQVTAEQASMLSEELRRIDADDPLRCGRGDLRQIQLRQDGLDVDEDTLLDVRKPGDRDESVLKWQRQQTNASIPQTVGVFMNANLDEVVRIAETARLDCIQLHGQESVAQCRELKNRLGLPLIKVFPVAGSTDADELCRLIAPYRECIDIALLDTHDPVYGGGTGKTFRWDILSGVIAWTRQCDLPLFVAGGVHAGNVRELMDQYVPNGVDVSSGVETDGRKDPAKISHFVKRVKS